METFGSLSPAILGIVGVALGALISIYAVRGGDLARFNSDEFNRRYSYLAEILRAAEAQYIAYRLDAQAVQEFIAEGNRAVAEGRAPNVFYEAEPELLDRIKVSTQKWRDVVALRYLQTDEYVERAIGIFDAQRGVIAGRNLDTISEDHEQFEVALRILQRAARIAHIRVSLTVVNSHLIGWPRRTHRKQLLSVLEGEKSLFEVEVVRYKETLRSQPSN
ncbi:hypothetical protein GCM10010401_06620 [Rarobacter faecitabidus]|uniref:Uncharacterized protein n=1 Tax=Rarobacter faecitabidus TaxID=13243 RepID=A0A542ZTQ1_RARFA|nr:hypothetical protein [Rarobacter faecitabidus]TQL63590.1 hypothetical protein FB461_0052 [Rarobacter faecitabidus]